MKDLISLYKIIGDENAKIEDRFRALFEIKENPLNKNFFIELEKGMETKSDLLAHEIIYVLGQIGNELSIDLIKKTLIKHKSNIVRHECAEALGALGRMEDIPILQEFSLFLDPLIGDSCLLAIKRIEDSNKTKFLEKNNKYSSIDPSIADEEKDICFLKKKFLNQAENLYNRYKSMFSLRNIDTVESSLILCEGLKDKNPLFSHEVAFVLGQMNKPETIPALIDRLDDIEEAPIVRHECAFALGSIATKDAVSCLLRNVNDCFKLVSESCIVGLDMCKKYKFD